MTYRINPDIRFRQIRATDIRTWSAILEGVQGAYGSREDDADPLLAGGLWGVLPSTPAQCFLVANALVDKAKAEAAGAAVKQSRECAISIDAWRAATSLFSSAWLVRVGLVLGSGKDVDMLQSLVWFSTEGIPSVFTAVRLASNRGSEFPKLYEVFKDPR